MLRGVNPGKPIEDITVTGYYTKQNCSVCGKTIKIEALDFLMNLDKPVVCDKCKRLKRR